jgi:DNA-binding MarR family transcriptional regulator
MKERGGLMPSPRQVNWSGIGWLLANDVLLICMWLPLLILYVIVAISNIALAKVTKVSYHGLTMKDLTTYQTVVLQSRAHRAIKAHLTQLLKEHGVTMMQWSILGLVSDAGEAGVRISDLAHTLDTSLAFITTSVNVLEAKGFVIRAGHSQDNRAKLVRLSTEFAPKIAAIEADIATKQQDVLYSIIDTKDMSAYLRVLRSLAKTA